ncbi:hypothetical protein BLA6863_01803 [Burkholderia lata]|uniref:Uncharacterized protein n=3 Tax=Burkholderia lata (strain ATCC 17760 / DSM 23089 / LMG 22485 / NCIMB 9086 / R18194 / 383) TaxID=482957 RepID=A0A6P2JDC8_BURL3|nr:hypothetical protein BLA6863_01803 [Burkholderia lata]
MYRSSRAPTHPVACDARSSRACMLRVAAAAKKGARKPEYGDTQRGRCYGRPRRAVNRERLRVPYIGDDDATLPFGRLVACSFGLQRWYAVARRDVRRSCRRGRWDLQGSGCSCGRWSGRHAMAIMSINNAGVTNPDGSGKLVECAELVAVRIAHIGEIECTERCISLAWRHLAGAAAMRQGCSVKASNCSGLSIARPMVPPLAIGKR